MCLSLCVSVLTTVGICISTVHSTSMDVLFCRPTNSCREMGSLKNQCLITQLKKNKVWRCDSVYLCNSEKFWKLQVLYVVLAGRKQILRVCLLLWLYWQVSLTLTFTASCSLTYTCGSCSATFKSHFKILFCPKVTLSPTGTSAIKPVKINYLQKLYTWW